jgi:hypothetical protein
MMEPPRLAELRRRLAADPSSLAFAALAEEYRRAGLPAEAVAACVAGLAHHPGYLSARVTLGRSLLELGETDAARAELEEAANAAPENLAAHRALAEALLRLGRRADALEHYQRAAQLAPQDAALAGLVAAFEGEPRELDPPDAPPSHEPLPPQGPIPPTAAIVPANDGTAHGEPSLACRAPEMACGAAAPGAGHQAGGNAEGQLHGGSQGVALALAPTAEALGRADPMSAAKGPGWRWPFRLVKSARDAGPPPLDDGPALLMPAREDVAVMDDPILASPDAAPQIPTSHPVEDESVVVADPASNPAAEASLERFLAAIRRERQGRPPCADPGADPAPQRNH